MNIKNLLFLAVLTSSLSSNASMMCADYFSAQKNLVQPPDSIETSVFQIAQLAHSIKTDPKVFRDPVILIQSQNQLEKLLLEMKSQNPKAIKLYQTYLKLLNSNQGVDNSEIRRRIQIEANEIKEIERDHKNREEFVHYVEKWEIEKASESFDEKSFDPHKLLTTKDGEMSIVAFLSKYLTEGSSDTYQLELLFEKVLKIPNLDFQFRDKDNKTALDYAIRVNPHGFPKMEIIEFIHKKTILTLDQEKESFGEAYVEAMLWGRDWLYEYIEKLPFDIPQKYIEITIDKAVERSSYFFIPRVLKRFSHDINLRRYHYNFDGKIQSFTAVDMAFVDLLEKKPRNIGDQFRANAKKFIEWAAQQPGYDISQPIVGRWANLLEAAEALNQAEVIAHIKARPDYQPVSNP